MSNILTCAANTPKKRYLTWMPARWTPAGKVPGSYCLCVGEEDLAQALRRGARRVGAAHWAEYHKQVDAEPPF